MSCVQNQASLRCVLRPTTPFAACSLSNSRTRMGRLHGGPSRAAFPSRFISNSDPITESLTITRAAVSEDVPHVISHYSIDIESVATGERCDERAAAHVALVDEDEHVLADLYIKPEKPIVSYITPITGLTQDVLEEKGMPLQEAVEKLKEKLPKDAVLVGQDVEHDVKELGLEQGNDFKTFIDLPQLFKVFSKQGNSWMFYTVEHVAKAVLGIRPTEKYHNAVDDALLCIKVFKFYMEKKDDKSEWLRARKKIMTLRKPQSFSTSHPIYEGVCMGNTKKCQLPSTRPCLKVQTSREVSLHS